MEDMEQTPDFKKIFLGILIGASVLGVVIYQGYRFSQRNSQLNSPTGESAQNPPTAPLIFTAAEDTPWITVNGLVFPYSFSIPETLTLERFKDPIDSLGISWGNIDPKANLLVNIEEIKKNTPEYVGKPQEYVENWWKMWSGLAGLNSVERFTNSKGLVSYKATYLTPRKEVPNVNVFFVIPGNDSIMIHLANGILEEKIFDRIVDSFSYAPEPTEVPTTE